MTLAQFGTLAVAFLKFASGYLLLAITVVTASVSNANQMTQQQVAAIKRRREDIFRTITLGMALVSIIVALTVTTDGQMGSWWLVMTFCLSALLMFVGHYLHRRLTGLSKSLFGRLLAPVKPISTLNDEQIFLSRSVLGAILLLTFFIDFTTQASHVLR